MAAFCTALGVSCWFLRVSSSLPLQGFWLYFVPYTFLGLYRMFLLPVLSVHGFRPFVVACGPFGCWCAYGALRGLLCWQLSSALACGFLAFFFTSTFGHLVLRLKAVSRSSPPVGGFPGYWLSYAVLSGFLRCFPYMLLCLGFLCRLLFQRFVLPSGSVGRPCLGLTWFLCAVACLP